MLAMNVQPTRASRQPAPSLTTIASKLGSYRGADTRKIGTQVTKTCENRQ